MDAKYATYSSIAPGARVAKAFDPAKRFIAFAELEIDAREDPRDR